MSRLWNALEKCCENLDIYSSKKMILPLKLINKLRVLITSRQYNIMKNGITHGRLQHDRIASIQSKAREIDLLCRALTGGNLQPVTFDDTPWDGTERRKGEAGKLRDKKYWCEGFEAGYQYGQSDRYNMGIVNDQIEAMYDESHPDKPMKEKESPDER